MPDRPRLTLAVIPALLDAFLIGSFALVALACDDECDGKERTCDGDMILVCDDGQWEFLEHCAGPTSDFTCAEDCSEHYEDKPAKPCCIPGGYIPEV